MIRKHKIGLNKPKKQPLGLAGALAREAGGGAAAAAQRVLREQFWLPRSHRTNAFIQLFSALGAEPAPRAVRSKKND